jgi:nitrous oxide reductase accessory protein NosL
MNKKILFAALVFAALLSSCSKEKPACQKVMYKIGETEVITYQWMTRTEAEATFSKYNEVRIFEEKAADVECLLKNEDNK